MRPRVLLLVVGLGLLLIGALALLRQKTEQPGENSNSRQAASGQPLPASEEAPSLAERSSPTGHVASTAQSLERSNPPVAKSRAAEVVPQSAEARHKAYVEARIEELDDLSTQDDSTSLQTILSELSNRDPEIRKAARDAAVQFGSRDAIPKLSEAAAQTDEAEEKADLLDAIEFLKLPSLSEVLAKREAGQTGQTTPSKPKKKFRIGPKQPPATQPNPVKQ